MSEKQTITINGRFYDARTGLAVDTPSVATSSTPVSTSHSVNVTSHSSRPVAAANVHSSTQKSQTLNRKSIKPPVVEPKPFAVSVAPRRQVAPRTTTVLPRSAHISKFAKHPVTAAPQRAKVMDIGPVSHPHVVKAHALSQAKAESKVSIPVHQLSRPQAHTPAPVQPHKPAHVVKNDIIQSAIENTRKHPTAAKKRFMKRHPRVMSIVTASFALVIMGGYLTYLNMPSLSVRVAAAQAGIDASYPNYRPDGYSLNGPVAYDQGEVTMKFAANGGPQDFVIKQTKSGWDSAAVLDNYVTPKAGVSYIPYTERGLTIYTYDGNAAWVNGGILYTIEGNAPLSSEQIRRIATSFI